MNQLRLLLNTMGMSVQRDAARRPRVKRTNADPAPLFALAFLFVMFMMMRTPGVSHALVDFLQVIRMGSVALMVLSGIMIASKLMLEGEQTQQIEEPRVPDPPTIMAAPASMTHAIAYGADGRRYAMVELGNNPGSAPRIVHSEAQEERLPVEALAAAPSPSPSPSSSLSPSPLPDSEDAPIGRKSNE